jgi:hypothetical protein
MPKLIDFQRASLPDLPEGFSAQMLWAVAKGTRALWVASNNDVYFMAMLDMQRGWNVYGWVKWLEAQGQAAEGTAERWGLMLQDTKPLSRVAPAPYDPIIMLRNSLCRLNPTGLSATQLTDHFKMAGGRVPFAPSTVTIQRQGVNARAKKLGGKYKALWVDAEGQASTCAANMYAYIEISADGRGETGALTLQPVNDYGAQLFQSELAWDKYGATNLVTSPLYRFNAQAWALVQYRLAVLKYWQSVEPERGLAWAKAQGCPILGTGIDLEMADMGVSIAELGLMLAQSEYIKMKTDRRTSIKLPFYLPNETPIEDKDNRVRAPGSVLVRHYVNSYQGHHDFGDASKLRAASAAGTDSWPRMNPWYEMERKMAEKHEDKAGTFTAGGTRVGTLNSIIQSVYRWVNLQEK